MSSISTQIYFDLIEKLGFGQLDVFFYQKIVILQYVDTLLVHVVGDEDRSDFIVQTGHFYINFDLNYQNLYIYIYIFVFDQN